MDDFIMAEHEDKGLMECVDERERDGRVVIAPENGILRHIVEEVVHPTHVPFETEAQAAQVGGTRYARPGGAFLSDRHNARMALVAYLVEAFQKIDRIQVLATSVNVRHPIAWLARVVEVEHRGHGIDAQSGDVR